MAHTKSHIHNRTHEQNNVNAYVLSKSFIKVFKRERETTVNDLLLALEILINYQCCSSDLNPRRKKEGKASFKLRVRESK